MMCCPEGATAAGRSPGSGVAELTSTEPVIAAESPLAQTMWAKFGSQPPFYGI